MMAATIPDRGMKSLALCVHGNFLYPIILPPVHGGLGYCISSSPVQLNIDPEKICLAATAAALILFFDVH